MVVVVNRHKSYWADCIGFQVHHTMFHHLCYRRFFCTFFSTSPPSLLLSLLLLYSVWLLLVLLLFYSFKQHPNWFIVLNDLIVLTESRIWVPSASRKNFTLWLFAFSSARQRCSFSNCFSLSFTYLFIHSCSLPFATIDIYSVTIEMLCKLLFVLCVLIPWIGICRCENG